MSNKIKSTSKLLACLASILSLLLGSIIGISINYYSNTEVSDVLEGELQIHVMELGNGDNGDSILIQVGNTDVLVDAGSSFTSYRTLKGYIDKHVKDKKIEYVISTHAHYDHYANFAGNGVKSLLTDYKIDNIIMFSNTNQTTNSVYKHFLSIIDKKKKQGTKVCNVLESYNNKNGCQRIISLSEDVEIEILNNYYYNHYSNEENNYSICFMINQNDNHFLFTGDLEKPGETKLVELNALPKMKLFKAGHHGSKTSSNDVLLSVIQPEYVVISCVAGSVQYTQNPDGVFPTTRALETISKYTDKVYVTTQAKLMSIFGSVINVSYKPLNGTIIVRSSENSFSVTGSNNSTILKDTQWYKDYYAKYRKTDMPW